MKFIYGKQDFKTLERGEENCYLMTNGLGGFSSLTVIGSCGRNDHAVLMSCSAAQAPNHRYNMIHRLEEILMIGERELHLSSQDFAGQGKREEGYRYLSSFAYEDYPVWRYDAEGVEIVKKMALLPGSNTVGISYTLENHSGEKAVLKVLPRMEFVSKGERLSPEQEFFYEELSDGKGTIRSNGQCLFFQTNGRTQELPSAFETDLYYAYDACDGREEIGCTAVNHSVSFETEPGQRLEGEMVYGTEPVRASVSQILESLTEYRAGLRRKAGFEDETAQALAVAANQFVSYRASTDKQTILAGFPFFEDWGRDTMIALTGCCISTGQYETAESILRTFMMYCRKGLMPNLFPEGKEEPRYNTVDAALLFIIAVYEYFVRTSDKAFVISAWDVMQEIVEQYAAGTDFHIGMDEDGLIHAGEGFDQVTWMDVRVGDILPTPRHGKPVEINAYWYNALCIMDFFSGKLAGELPENDRDYAAMAEQTGKSFREKFWNQKAGCLKDVLSEEKEAPESAGDGKGRPCPDSQIRCNQIWAVSLPFSLLDREREKQVVETVYRKLYTPLGLRTLSMDDPEFHPFYGGQMLERDLAYHQGTVWAFPLGGYYLAYLKVNDYSEAAKERVRAQLQSITAALREGCIGQLPEIYDGAEPVSSKGCFAQAWSVGELLRVYEALEREDRG